MTKPTYNAIRRATWWCMAASWWWRFATPKGRRFMQGVREVILRTVEFPGEWNRARLAALPREARAVYRLFRQVAFRCGEPDPFSHDNGVVWMPVEEE